MSNFMRDQCGMLKKDRERYNKLELGYRPTLQAILGEENDYTLIAHNIINVFDDKHFKLIRYAGAYDTIVFDFKINGNEYSIDTLEEALRLNVPKWASPRNTSARSAYSFITRILRLNLPSKEKQTVMDLIKHAQIKEQPNQLLIRFRDFVDAQNYEGAFEGLLQYPYLNQERDVKQHLMLGFSSNSGKTLINTMMSTIYHGVSRKMGVRNDIKNAQFDKGGWNLRIQGAFLVIIDDDDIATPPSEDFLKNTMGNVPLETASQGYRGQYIFKGSIMLALNNEHEHFKKTEIDKRIKLISMNKALSKRDNVNGEFTQSEVDELYRLAHDISELATFMFFNDRTRNFVQQKKNMWNSGIEDEIKVTFPKNNTVVSSKLLHFAYTEKKIDNILKKLSIERTYVTKVGVNGNRPRMPYLRSTKREKVDTKNIINIVHQHGYNVNLEERHTKRFLIRLFGLISLTDTFDDAKTNEYDGGIYFVELAKGKTSSAITTENVTKYTAFVGRYKKEAVTDLHELATIIHNAGFSEWVVVKSPLTEKGNYYYTALVFIENKETQEQYNETCKKLKVEAVPTPMPLSFSDVITSETFKIDY